MRTLIAAAVGLALLAGGPTRAEIVSIPLGLDPVPSHLGEPGSVPLVLPFDAGRPLADITQVGLRVRASTDFDRLYCWIFGDYGGGVTAGRDVLGFVASFTAGGEVLAESTFAWPPEDHPDEFILSVDRVLALNPADWSFLADGRGTLELRGLDCTRTWSYPTVCICDASFVLMSVELVIGLDGSLPARGASWGAVKARYR